MVGLHLRFSRSIEEVLEKAHHLSLPLFQSFLLDQTGKYLTLSPELVSRFQKARDSFNSLYAHSSYLINLAHPEYHPLLKKELYIAQKLQFSHLLFHPGAVSDGSSRSESLDVLVRRLNEITKEEQSLNIVIENSAHLKKALGGDIRELQYIQSRLEFPEKVSFCLDTAHAYVFGYDIAQECESWMSLVTELLSSQAIGLIHLNDTQERSGSGNDKHCMLGEGLIGFDILKKIVQDDRFKNTPLILELPEKSLEDEKALLQEVRLWKKRD